MSDGSPDIDQPSAHPARDPRSTGELFRVALAEPDVDARWRAVQALHWRGGRDVFDRAAALCQGARPIERMTGADVLAELGLPDHDYPDEATAILAALLERERDARVLASVLTAFGHLGGPPDLGVAAPLADHADPAVRHSLAYALGFREEPLAVETLIALTRDEEANVRDWATFGLGQGDADSPALRDALAVRLDDEDDDVRAEAIAGLGHRVSIVTNLSASQGRLAAFVRAAAGRVGVFSCSLHLEYVEDVDAYCDKARWLQDALCAAADPSLPAPHLCVTSVATRAALPGLPGLHRRFAEVGLAHKIQPEKQDGAVIEYAPDEAAVLLQLGGHNRTGAIENDFRGMPCWAGARYFVLDDGGQAFRCYPSRRARLEPLADFLSPSFALFEDARPCRYRSCTCTVPIARGMMPREVA